MDITIKDVAREANVATSTVSRVLKDSPAISEATKRKVREVMDRMGYYPNFQAQSLAGRNTQTIGIIMPNSAYHSFGNPFFSEVLRGISIYASEKKYGLYLSTSATEEHMYEEVVAMVQGKRVDGILMLYSRKNDKLMTYLEGATIPLTVIGRPYKKSNRITFVDNDNIDTTKKITSHLIKLGHRRIGFIGGSLEFVVTIDRLQGYKDALKEAGIEADSRYIIHNEEMKRKREDLMNLFLSQDKAPTALVVQDDLTAYEMISLLEASGIQVPDDVSIISFNNHSLSEHSRPALTSVDIHIFQLGYEATGCLIDQIKNPATPVKRIIIPADLIIRDSCTPFCRE